MTFLEARRILADFQGGPPLKLHLATSGTAEPFVLYVRAAAAARGRAADVTTLPFGTLGQALLTPPLPDRQEVVLLMPWDLAPECDWRSGLPARPAPPEALLDAAQVMARTLAARSPRLLYLPAPLPPLYLDANARRLLAHGLATMAANLGAVPLAPQCFSLGKYLAEGVPVAGASMGEVAEAIVATCLNDAEGSAKVLVTDLDNVLWAGLAAEEGPDGIECGAGGRGFRHFLYQGLLRQLRAGGVLLAAVSRNDTAVARAPIAAGRTMLAEDDFVAILASYEPKSVHLKRLAESLNLGLDACVFVDDNPIELAEVSAGVPQVRCVQFPPNDDQLPAFLQDVAQLFARSQVTAEDAQRTEMYRRRLAVAEARPAGDGADLSAFLAGLKMELTVFDRTVGDRLRAVQLINKTNQFSLNGRRFSDEEVARILADGGRLYTATLEDRSGSHGEILACLLDQDLTIRAFVLSCRVFQRHVEHAFLCWLASRIDVDPVLDFAATERNTPIRLLLDDPAFTVSGDVRQLRRVDFAAAHGPKLALFKVSEGRVH